MWSHHRGLGTPSDGSAERLRLLRKARERIGIEHHRALTLERGENQVPHGLPHATAWSQQHDVTAGIIEEARKFIGAIDRSHHDREACRWIYLERFARRGDGDESPP